ncbi:hypothetical protein PFISCL1PPCAC_15580, partial [Pristionchus fissidentatus]
MLLKFFHAYFIPICSADDRACRQARVESYIGLQHSQIGDSVTKAGLAASADPHAWSTRAWTRANGGSSPPSRVSNPTIS